MKKIKTIVLDTSTIVKPLLQENGKEKVEKMFHLKENFKLSILVPDIFRYEYMNTICRELNTEIAEEGYKTFTARQVSIIPMDFDLIRRTTKITEKYPKASFYDAAFHALAKAYGIDFITADKRYYELTKKEGNIKLLQDLKL